MTSKISRFPGSHESVELQRRNHEARCLMEPDAADMKFAVVGKCPQEDIARNRALKAGPPPRRAVLELFDLREDWRSNVLSVAAVGYGQFPNSVGGHGGLLSLISHAAQQEVGNLILRAFKAGGGEEGGGRYHEALAVRAFEEAVCPEQFRRPEILRDSLIRLANYCGLRAKAREYRFMGGCLGWLASTPPKYDLDRVLAHGWASFEGEDTVRALLEKWAGLANQRGQQMPLPELTRESIIQWAQAERRSAYDEEGSNAPNSKLGEDNPAEIVLSWQGTFTQGRWIALTVDFEATEGVPHARLQWCSGTGRPSSFLSVENLLGLDGCVEFGALQSAELELVEEAL